VTTAHFTGTQGTPDSVTSYFMGGQYEVKDGAVKKYYSIAGMMVAMNDGSGLQYLLTDHLGSTVAVTNASGTLTSQQRYLPFGEARTIPNSPILGTDFTYTGQRLLDSGMGGIMDYKARFYLPYLNRFLQPDTIIPDQFNPQSWNRYSYTFNNPIRYNDPDGHCPPGIAILCGAAIGAIAGATISYVRQVATNVSENGWSSDALTKVDTKDIVAAATVGAIAGALIGSGVGASAGAALLSPGAAAVATGAGTGMATSAIGYTLAAGKDYKTSEMVASAVVGGVAGAATGAVSYQLAKPLTWQQGKAYYNQSGNWFLEAGINSTINASASVAQTVWINKLNNRPTSRDEIGYSIIFGGGTGTLLDLNFPGVGGLTRSAVAETINNSLLNKVPKKPIAME